MTGLMRELTPSKPVVRRQLKTTCDPSTRLEKGHQFQSHPIYVEMKLWQTKRQLQDNLGPKYLSLSSEHPCCEVTTCDPSTRLAKGHQFQSHSIYAEIRLRKILNNGWLFYSAVSMVTILNLGCEFQSPASSANLTEIAIAVLTQTSQLVCEIHRQEWRPC